MLLNPKKYFTLLIFLLPALIGKTQVFPDSVQHRLQELSNEEKIHYLGDLCWQLRESNREISLKAGEMAIKLADSLGILSEAAKYDNILGVSFLNYHSDIKKALNYFNQAYEKALKANDSIQLGYAYNNLGDIYQINGDIPLAQAYADSSFHYFELINYPLGIGYSYINLGNAKLLQKQYQEAKDYFQKAMDLYSEHHANNIVSSAKVGLAKVYSAQKNYEKALELYYEDLKITREMGYKTYEASSLLKIADILVFQHQYENALEKYEQARILYQDRKDISGLCEVAIGKAKAYSQINQKEACDDELEQALLLAQKLGIPRTLLKVYKIKLQIDYSGRNNESSELIDKYLAIHDSLYLAQQFEILNEVRQKQAITYRLNQANTEIQTQRKETLLWTLLLGMFIILIFVLIWKNRTSSRLSKKLADLNTGKDKLLSIISHDLKNPFISIIQYLELLKTDDLPEEQQGAFVKQLDIQTKNTLALLENLLNLSSFRIKALKASPSNFDLIDLVNQVEDNLKPQLHLKSIAIKTDIGIQTIYADEKMIEIVIRNLISNAIKYSHPSDVVYLKSYQSKDAVNIEVTDQGVGISEQVKAELFSDQFANSIPGTGGETGTGIGLKICQELISLHQGQITVESTMKKGTTFRIQLPLQKQS